MPSASSTGSPAVLNRKPLSDTVSLTFRAPTVEIPRKLVSASYAPESDSSRTCRMPREVSRNYTKLIAKPWVILAMFRRQTRGKKYVPLNLVYSYWANLGRYREIGDARAYSNLLDDRARHHRIDHRWRR